MQLFAAGGVARDFDCHFIVFGNHQNANKNFSILKEAPMAVAGRGAGWGFE